MMSNFVGLAVATDASMYAARALGFMSGAFLGFL
jgi:hypothetical protein